MKPKMIMFDYGHTLLWENDFDFRRGYRAIFEFVSENRSGADSDELWQLSEGLFKEVDVCRKLGYELHEFPILRCTTEALGIKFCIPIEKVEQVLWTNSSKGGKMPHIDELLEYLKAEGIRTAVISNIGWSGGALKERIDRLLPENGFEFIIASSEYAVRKPNPLLFRAALQRAGLEPEEVWYCGDNIANDVAGAHSAGIFPVHYDCKEVKNPRTKCDIKPDYEYLHISDWRELIDILKEK